MTAILPAPRYVLARAAWVPTLVIWHADGRLTRLEGEPCADYAAALAASWRLRDDVNLRPPFVSVRVYLGVSLRRPRGKMSDGGCSGLSSPAWRLTAVLCLD